MTEKSFETVTELAGEPVSREQLARIAHRYRWAASYCNGKEVVEAACGAGQGLGLLAGAARSVRAGDFSLRIIAAAQHAQQPVPVARFDATRMPFSDCSADVILLAEALYYLPSATDFFAESRRVLRPGGRLLIATANKDLYDFNPSPFSTRYLGVVELAEELGEAGFETELFGAWPVASVSLRQRLLRPAKRMAVALGLMPRTMAGKRLLKRLVFGSLVPMPALVDESMGSGAEPMPISSGTPDRVHKVLYCAAKLANGEPEGGAP